MLLMAGLLADIHLNLILKTVHQPGLSKIQTIGSCVWSSFARDVLP